MWVKVHDPHIQCNSDTDRISDPSPVDTESDEKCPPKCNVKGSGHHPRGANVGGGKKRRIWPRNLHVLKYALGAEMQAKKKTLLQIHVGYDIIERVSTVLFTGLCSR